MGRGVRPAGPWIPLNEAETSRVGGYTGVFELADDADAVIRIGFAGGSSLFGLGGELRACIGTAASFRYEVTTSYVTRYAELLMLHCHDTGELPRLNDDDPASLGRLSPS